MFKDSRWVKFIGGGNLLFTLIVLILVGLTILVFREFDFLFRPFVLIVSNILLPVVISLLLYYLFVPIVDFLEKRGLKRVWGVALLYVSLLVIIGGAIGIAIPALQSQLVSFVESFPTFVESLSETVLSWLGNFPGVESFDQLLQSVEDWIGQLPQNIIQFLQGGVSGLQSVVSSVTSAVVTLVLVPIILFFLLKDADRFYDGFLSAIPPSWRTDVVRIATEINEQVGSYVKGQLMVALANGILMYIGFTIIGLSYSGVLAIVGGFTSIIPYLGPTITFIPAVIVAIFDSWFMVVKLIIVWLVVQFIEGNLIEPNVMGRQLNIHPLTIIIVLFVMGDLLGLFGLIFGIPLYAILKIIVIYFFELFKRRYNRFYGDIAGEYSLRSPEEIVANVDKDENLEEYKEAAFNNEDMKSE